MENTKTHTIWVVTPCYYECESFRRLYQEILVTTKEHYPNHTTKVVLIDDSAGMDKEVFYFKTLGSCLVVTPAHRLGHQSAIVFALRKLSAVIAETDYVVTMDADGEDNPKDIISLLDPLFALPNKLDQISLAERTKRFTSLSFKFSYLFFRIFYRLLTGVVIRHGNFIAYRGKLLKSIIFKQSFDYCYSATFISLKLNVNRIPIARSRRYLGKTKMSYASLVRHAFSMLLPMSKTVTVRSVVISTSLFVCGGGLLASYIFFGKNFFVGLLFLIIAISSAVVLSVPIVLLIIAKSLEIKAAEIAFQKDITTRKF